MSSAPICCGQPARLTTGAEVYPHRPDLHDKPIWRCDVCPDAYVGCHPGTTEPLGTPAGPDLRRARRMLHERMIDPLWQTADRSGAYGPLDEEGRRVVRQAARGRVYGFLADRMGLTRDETHTGLFDLEQCRAAWRALSGVAYPEIREWAQRRRAAPRKRAA